MEMRRALMARCVKQEIGLATAAPIYRQSLGREKPMMSLRETIFLTVATIIALVLITVAASYCIASPVGF